MTLGMKRLGLRRVTVNPNPPPSAVPEIVAVVRETICENCDWNLDGKWICQNPAIDCPPCKMRNEGGLLNFIRQRQAKCPVKRW
jgi:hypothetical protein